jgi:polyisoprenoid-binding protein YceI
MHDRFPAHTLRASLLLAVALLASSMLRAQQNLVIDPARSEVHFTLGDVLHTVHGTFHIQQGEVAFNRATGEASGSIVVDALSGQSGNSMRDGRMARDQLKAQSYKEVTFAPTHFTGEFKSSGDSSLTVHGVFTLLGVAHEIDVPMQVQVNGNQVHAVGKFTVPYVQWGLKDPSTLMLRVKKEVQIELSLMGVLQP